MVGKVGELKDILIEDQLGTWVADRWVDYDNAREPKKREMAELRSYIFATDTSHTTNATLPWKNKTTIPKLCQTRDNLFANYMATMFPKRKSVTWEANIEDSNSVDKKDAIENMTKYMTDQDSFKSEIGKCVLDYIDWGNCFATVVWEDNRVELEDKIQAGYVGPSVRRISPLDIVFNPIATSFKDSPKIIRSLLTIGEIKEVLERLSSDEDQEAYNDLWKYLKGIRDAARESATDLSQKDAYFEVDGFDSFQRYLESDYVELLTYYGDLYDYENDEYLRNYVVMVVDRHKVISKKPNRSFFGYPQVFHAGWRVRQDNLWAMGPLDNLVGLQYRIDHIENLKADVFDLITFPPLKVRGYVEDFEWGPFEKIIVGDANSDVEIMAPPFQVLTANQEIQLLSQWIEELAGSPKEAMGFRTPGEKTKYEVQRLENAASRIFQHKTAQFEEVFLEPLYNAMIEMARRKLNETIQIPIFDNDYKMVTFMSLGPADITGSGRIRPIAARNFAEKAEIVQNLTAFLGSPVGQDPLVNLHFSGQRIAELMENVLDLEDFKLYQPYIKLQEQAHATQLANSAKEQIMMQSQTPSGLTPDDADQEMLNNAANQQPQGQVPGR